MVTRADSLFGVFTATARQRGRAPAMTFLSAALEPVSYSFEQLFERVDALAARLDRHGFATGAPIGILLDSQEAQVLHYLAALSRQLVPAILTPPNRKFHAEEYLRTIRRVLDYSRFAAVITAIPVDDEGTPLLAPGTLDVRQAGGARDGVVDAAFLQFSSGTTGIKRGVMVTTSAVLAQIDAYAAAIALTPDDRIVSWLPLYHDMGFMTALNMALACGVHAIMLPPLAWVADPGLYLRAVSQHRATLGWHPNFAFAFMADRVREADCAALDLSSLRGVVNCSEPVTAESQSRFLSRFSRYGLRGDVFWGCYAMAETTFAVTHGVSSDPGYLDPVGSTNSRRARVGSQSASQPFVSVGRPIAGVEVRVTNAAGLACDEREIGELWVKAPFLFDGYYHNPDATRDAFADGWYRTGDLGYRLGAELFVCGRIKDVIIVGGVNVYPQDIEDHVSRVPGVHPGRVAAFAVFDPAIQTERIMVLAETDLGGIRDDPEGGGLVTTIRQSLAAAFQMTGCEVHLVPPGWLVKSSAGKMARRATREKWLAGLGR